MRRRKQQAAWRARHPDYFAGRRIQARMVLEDRPGPLRLPPPLDQLPWDIAQSEFGVKGADFIGVMGTLLVHAAQSELLAYALDSRTDGDTLPPPAAQSEMRVGPD